jgi:hypothetical protein
MKVERKKLWTHKFLICNEEQGEKKEVIWGIKYMYCLEGEPPPLFASYFIFFQVTGYCNPHPVHPSLYRERWSHTSTFVCFLKK